MMRTLEMARQKQINNEPIGKIDLNGSFTTLLKRGLIDSKIINVNGEKVVVWYVTNAGLNALNVNRLSSPEC